jgi:hypothetical protein
MYYINTIGRVSSPIIMDDSTNNNPGDNPDENTDDNTDVSFGLSLGLSSGYYHLGYRLVLSSHLVLSSGFACGVAIWRCI